MSTTKSQKTFNSAVVRLHQTTDSNRVKHVKNVYLKASRANGFHPSPREVRLLCKLAREIAKQPRQTA